MENFSVISYNTNMSKINTQAVPDTNLAILCQDIRAELSKTLREMADLLSISESTYRNWEKGRSEPTGQAMYKLLKLRDLHQKNITKARTKKPPVITNL